MTAIDRSNMERLRNWALRLIIILNIIALTDSFGESYAGLYRWAFDHTITGFWAGTWPLMIDTMILAGEAGLFVAHHDRWRTRDKIWMWSGTIAALGVSVAANVGHVQSTDWLSHLTAALPPVALAFVTTVGFGVMKRVHVNKKPGEKSSHTIAYALTETVSPPLTETRETPLTKTVSQPETEVISRTETDPDETVAAGIPESLSTTETFINPGFKVTPKSYTLPRDPRTEITLTEKRVRDMVDVDPDITVNAVAKALGIAWATAKKYLEATKEARGLAA